MGGNVAELVLPAYESKRQWCESLYRHFLDGVLIFDTNSNLTNQKFRISQVSVQICRQVSKLVHIATVPNNHEL
jgi:hypothetical protein